MVVQQRRQRAHQQAGEHHAHPVVGAADDGQRIQQDRLAGVKTGVVELAVQPGNQAAAQAGQCAAKGESPGLVAQHADASGHGCGLALADQRPGAAGHGGALPLNRRHGQRQPQHGIAEIAFVAARNPGALDQRAGATDHLAGKAGPAVREADHVDGHLERRRHHQRQQRQVQAAHAHGRQADHHAEQAGHHRTGQQCQFERQCKAVHQAQADPAAHAGQRKLRQRDHAQLTVQQRHRTGDQGQAGDRGEGVDPVRGQQPGADQRDHGKGDQHGRDAAQRAARRNVWFVLVFSHGLSSLFYSRWLLSRERPMPLRCCHRMARIATTKAAEEP